MHCPDCCQCTSLVTCMHSCAHDRGTLPVLPAGVQLPASQGLDGEGFAQLPSEACSYVHMPVGVQCSASTPGPCAWHDGKRYLLAAGSGGNGVRHRLGPSLARASHRDSLAAALPLVPPAVEEAERIASALVPLVEGEAERSRVESWLCAARLRVGAVAAAPHAQAFAQALARALHVHLNPSPPARTNWRFCSLAHAPVALQDWRGGWQHNVVLLVSWLVPLLAWAGWPAYSGPMRGALAATGLFFLASFGTAVLLFCKSSYLQGLAAL